MHNNITFACCNNPENNNSWYEADQKWQAFAKEHLERMRAHDSTTPAAGYPNYKFDMEWIELKSNLITKYLPDYRIYSDRRFEFILDKKGHIICLGTTLPLGRSFKNAPDLEVMDFSSFTNNLGIMIKDAETAINIVKLTDILFGNGHVNDTTIEEKTKNWRYTASKMENRWIIKISYVGPRGVSIFRPPYWEIDIDEKGKFESITEYCKGVEGFIDDLKRKL